MVHRLMATPTFLIRLLPFYEDQLVPLLNVLQVGETFERQAGGGREVEGEISGRSGGSIVWCLI